MNKKVWKTIYLCAIVAVLAFTPALMCGNKVDEALKFDPSKGTKINVTVDGAPLAVTMYTVTYVAYPIKIATQDGVAVSDPYAYQKMNIYVPATSSNNQKTAIILAVNNSGWAAHPVATSIVDGGNYVSTSDTDKVGAALKAGYIFVDVGTRSRGLQTSDGTYVGKAPAVVVDTKAAIRYLRLNDELIPGSSERIVITGTSGGGGLSMIISASGNSPDYYPDLIEIGAAGFDDFGHSILNDDVFATIAYCPITDFGHADISYEWQYSDIREVGDHLCGPAGFLPWWGTATLTLDMLDASIELKSQYPAYLASLGLVLEDGKTKLTAANMQDAITNFAIESIEKALKAGVSVPNNGSNFTGLRSGPVLVPPIANNWFTYSGTSVTAFDYTNWLTFVKATAPLKGAPSFDATGTYGNTDITTAGESDLFGSSTVAYSNFEEWAWDNNNVLGDGSGLDDTHLTWDQYIYRPKGSELEKQIKMTDPIAYLRSAKEGDSAPNWYVRYGLRDRDTSFAVEIALFYSIKNDRRVKNANCGLAYIQGHGGDYDVQEAYTWLAEVLKHPEGKH